MMVLMNINYEFMIKLIKHGFSSMVLNSKFILTNIYIYFNHVTPVLQWALT